MRRRLRAWRRRRCLSGSTSRQLQQRHPRNRSADIYHWSLTSSALELGKGRQEGRQGTAKGAVKGAEGTYF